MTLFNQIVSGAFLNTFLENKILITLGSFILSLFPATFIAILLAMVSTFHNRGNVTRIFLNVNVSVKSLVQLIITLNCIASISAVGIQVVR